MTSCPANTTTLSEARDRPSRPTMTFAGTFVLVVTAGVVVEGFSCAGSRRHRSQLQTYRQTSLQQQRPRRRRRRQRHDDRDVASSLPASSGNADLGRDEPEQPPWLEKGLLLSSFADGLRSDRDDRAQDWLCEALVERLWGDVQRRSERALHESGAFSPCNGPDPAVWRRLEDIDRQVRELYPASSDEDVASAANPSWRRSLELLLLQQQQQQSSSSSSSDDDNPVLELRLLYIPTALYALRKDSANTPGKQRQRARADGKKRRDEVAAMLRENFAGNVAVSAVTLDLDDGSVKQPECSIPTVKPSFPTTGKKAIRDWKPHLIYVQGGNTFWLYHCIDKGDWGQDLIDACCICSKSDDGPKAVFCGVSAGAIVIGNSMQTACWKEWDDPSVVPGRETYGDWTDVRGLGLVGSTSFFPHMEDQWQPIVDNRIHDLPRREGDDGDSPVLCCLSDEQVCFVDGRRRSIQSAGIMESSLQPSML